MNKHRLFYHKAHRNISTKSKVTALGNNVNNVKICGNRNEAPCNIKNNQK